MGFVLFSNVRARVIKLALGSTWILKTLGILSARFFKSVAFLIGCTALVKVITVFIDTPLLNYVNPVFGIRETVVLVGTACFEAVTACLIIASPSIRQKSLISLWLCSLFITYRLFAYSTIFPKLCPCLGHLQWLGVPDEYSGTITFGILLYIFSGSIITLSVAICRPRLELRQAPPGQSPLSL